LGPQGQIVSPEGYTIQPGITIPQSATDVSINPQGEVQVKLAGQVAPQTVGQLDLATFFNEAGLEATGSNLYLETPSSGAPNVNTPGSPGFGTISQGFIETSNVNPVSEITSLISAQRAYEMNSKVISTADQMLSVMSNLH